jgi:PhzF family phenazine biosynthesis protein
MLLPLFQVDAFTDRPFAGNPAAVCLLPAAADAAWMQAVANEMNLSETAFLHGEGDRLRLRWFTPTVEVALCGHATLAAAHVLWERGLLSAEATARFVTRSGELTARREGEAIVLDFPADPPAPAEPPPALLRALGVRAVAVARTRFDYLVEVATEAEVRAMTPDFTALRAVETRGVVVTSAAATPEVDFVSRFFAPAAGIDEDPVTGSAHCALGPYWAPRVGRQDLRAAQLSPRGGRLGVRMRGERVELVGRAVTVFATELPAPS